MRLTSTPQQATLWPVDDEAEQTCTLGDTTQTTFWDIQTLKIEQGRNVFDCNWNHRNRPSSCRGPTVWSRRSSWASIIWASWRQRTATTCCCVDLAVEADWARAKRRIRSLLLGQCHGQRGSPLSHWGETTRWLLQRMAASFLLETTVMDNWVFIVDRHICADGQTDDWWRPVIGYETDNHINSNKDPLQLVPRKIQAQSLKKQPILGAAASSVHSVVYTTTDIFTFGLNQGQLGYHQPADSETCQTSPRKVSMSTEIVQVVANVRAVEKTDAMFLFLTPRHNIGSLYSHSDKVVPSDSALELYATKAIVSLVCVCVCG